MQKEHNKLVRDGILDVLLKIGVEFHAGPVKKEEKEQKLIDKLNEEHQELLESISLEELADYVTAALALITERTQYITDFDDLKREYQFKLKERGGFDKGIMLYWTREQVKGEQE
jgi:predicted house-cleaning noncanonical NTP pyrophosphatase (MazG superfamily)